MNYFTEDELRCKCGCGENGFSQSTLDRLNALREAYGKPIRLTSAYRCSDYNKKLMATQTHATGQAVDIAIDRHSAYELLPLIYRVGFTGIGIKQHGLGRFIHIDDLHLTKDILRPTVWSY